MEVDQVMMRDWRIGTADAGLSRADIVGYWQEGINPAEFVAWFAEKYDLTRYDQLTN